MVRAVKKKKTSGDVPEIKDDGVSIDTPDNPPRALRPYLVGIGASAGGLEALSALIAALPTDLGISYVVLQHLSPTHRSMMAQLLGRETAMAVQEVENGIQPEPDTIYVAPASNNVKLKDGCFELIEGPREASPRPSVSMFLTSLAEEKIEDAIGVILSGTGSDGASGLRDIKAAGGYTFAQDPQTAKYTGMPQSAIDTGCVDWVLSPEEIAKEIAIIARSHGTVTVANKPPVGATTLKKLLIKVKQQTRIDFSGYKEGTLWRRIERRMAACHVNDLDDYLTLVDNNPEELEHLGKDILISVTAFFRDPASFGALRAMLNSILQTKRPGDEIRIWVPACATGEEAYTLAIMLAETLGPNINQFRIQIFATDIDLNALAVARKGSYAESALADLEPGLAIRYFQKVGNRLEVSRTLRDMVVVARQDLVQDPPFLRLDLVSCRNVLIYLQNDLQAKVLSTFHYSLNPNGLLFLGKSEGIFQQEALFEVLDKSARIYRRCAGESRLSVSAFRLPDMAERSVPKVVADSELRLLNEAVRRYVPVTVLINSTFDILHMHGDVGPFLTVVPGKPNFNLQNLLHRELRADLQLLQHQAEHKQESAVGRSHVIKIGGESRDVRLVVHPLDRGVVNPFFLVSFEIMPQAVLATGSDDSVPVSAEGRNVRELEEELISTRERLQTVIEELETSNEEMQALNEEVVAANEELQSSNEELEAANEELQSTNEELTTVNEELQVRTGELSDLFNDLENIQNSVGFPVMVCNAGLELIRFNSPAAALFSLSTVSIKQPITNMRLPVGMKEFSTAVHEAITSNRVGETHIFSNERHYLLHVSPYETKLRGTRGAIIVLLDHTERLVAERDTRKNREILLAIMNNSTSIISLKDLAGRYEFVNSQFEKFFGLSSQDLLGKTDTQVMSRKIADDFRTKELDVVRLRTSLEFEDHLAFSTGQERFLHSIRFPLLTEDGVVYSICTQSADVTEHKRAEDQLRLAARVFDRSGEGIVVTDAHQRILTVNHAFTQVTGYSPEEAIGGTPKMLASGKQDASFYKSMWSHLETHGWWQGEVWNKRKTGEVYPEWLTINAVHDPEGNVINYVGIFSDISVVKESQRKVEFLATHDELTGLPNRALFLDRLRQAIAHSERSESTFAVLFIDLDNFKVINDSMGHAAGDDLLKEISARLRDCVRGGDTVARFGGDEFALLIEEASVAEAEMTAHRIADAMLRPHPIGRQNVYPGASIGICLYPNDGVDPETLLKNADSAMYQAKDGGKRGHHFFTDELKRVADERLKLETELRGAIERDELFLMYQPQVDIGSGRLVGVEALVRWQHPAEGLIPPSKFIPLAEKTGIIDRLGEWVAATACRQMAAWVKQGHAIPRVSINVSPYQFRRSNIPAMMLRLLSQHGLDAHRVMLELTESALAEDTEQAQQVLQELKSLGIRLSIDDFGTGYSSLAYLRRLPIFELKIAQNFVTDIAHDADAQAIAKTILLMAQALGFSVVAEGIETEDQLAVLRNAGCDIGQGYLFAHPLRSEELIARFGSGVQ
ncbi:MAG TPA: PAS domain S-box protein [Gallionellaceae bacterium]|nr:PAS domain S-box protein [Gallionellaceae bacterium]